MVIDGEAIIAVVRIPVRLAILIYCDGSNHPDCDTAIA